MRKVHSLRKGIRRQSASLMGVSLDANRMLRRGKAMDSAGVEISRLPERDLGTVNIAASEGFVLGLDGLGEVPLA